MFNEMRVHTTSFVLHPKGMSSAPESRNLIFLPSLSHLLCFSVVFTDPPLSLSVCLTEGARRATTPRASCGGGATPSVRKNATRSPSSVPPRRSVCTRCYILRADGAAAVMHGMGMTFSLSLPFKRDWFTEKLCESLIAEERHATNSHLPAQRMQRNRMHASRVAWISQSAVGAAFWQPDCWY